MKTTQEVFDKVVTAYFINGALPGWNSKDQTCVYFDEYTEARCALGTAISLKAARWLGGKTVSATSVAMELKEDYPTIAAFVKKHINLLAMLQSAHDRAARLHVAPDGKPNLPKFREMFKHNLLQFVVENNIRVDLTILKEWREAS